MNPRLDTLHPYPFEKLRALLNEAGAPPEGLAPINLSIGEPKHAAPARVGEALCNSLQGLSVYPATKGDAVLRQTIAQWLAHRYSIPAPDADREVLPVLGSREALFAFTQTVVDPAANALVVCPNPFYQIYEGAALLAGGTPYYVNADPARDFGCDWDSVPADVWKRTQMVFVCSPGNPAGNVMSLDEWRVLFDLSDRYGFVIASDECYSEIYFDEGNPPLGGLQAARR
ncbi:aminotransferase class I/II-fold pyridoxal phosphate-dependent enzyme, partial [Bordetella tumulicola]|uniref:aminotransferase class I/II-fold pyridoxal phosphate-dependent enzyme n=1 Tax=Bordetella tumulicola TaxID=1649133 RepID=UPI0039F14503